MRFPAITVIFTLLLLAARLEAIPVIMHLEDGRTFNVDFDHATADGVVWRLAPGDPNNQKTPLSQISRIDFPPPPPWEEAEKVLAIGNLAGAYEKFSAIAKDQFRFGYPAPGNYASRALVRLLDIRRRQLDAAAIADQARIVTREAKTLPPGERDLPPAVQAWIALGKEEWENALKALETIEAADSEISYLKGRALEGQAETEKAVEAYAATYALGIGDRSEMSRDALRRSAVLLAALRNEERFPELHAQLKLYAELYGAGSLWTEAPEHFVKTAAAKLDTLSGMVDEPIVKETEEPAFDLTKLPPLEERDWILARELERKVFFVGHPPLVPEGDVAQLDDGWLFGGGKAALSLPDAFSFEQKEVRIRAAFTPKAPDGILINALNQSGGFDLYLEKGELKLSWSRQMNGADRKTFTIGNAILGVENRLSLTVNTKNVIGCWFNSQRALESEKVPDLINFKTAIPFAIGGRVGEGFVPADEMPDFTGIIHFLTIGADETIKDITDKELAMFDGKKILWDPPAPPAPEKAIAATPAQPGAAPAPEYTPPTITYDLTKLPRALDRDWILPQELEARVALIGRAPVVIEDAVETEAGWVFDGKKSRLRFDPVSLPNQRLRIRALFTPKNKNAVLFHAATKGKGLIGIYAIDGELVLIHRRNLVKRTRPVTLKLGKILPGVANNLMVQFADNHTVRGRLNNRPFPTNLKFGGPITEKAGLDLNIGVAGAPMTGKPVPSFEGTIHLMTIGIGPNQANITEKEIEFFEDKKLRYGPPPPPAGPAPLVPEIKKK